MITQLQFDSVVVDVSTEEVRGRRALQSPTWNDLRVLLHLLGTQQPKRCLEVGVYEGTTAKLLLDKGPHIEHYVGIDRTPDPTGKLTTPSVPGKHVKKDPRVELRLHRLGTRGLDAITLPHGPFDWIFIDSDHSYRGVKFDTTWALNVLAPCGLLLWHDYGAPSQYRPGGSVFGVKKYLDELARRHSIMSFVDPAHSSSVAFTWRENLV